MKMAIAMQCHANSEQINKIIEFFDDDDIDIYIHIDKKSNIKSEIVTRNNVYILDNNINVKWGQYSQVEATLELFKRIKKSSENYKYIHLISGQDYPVKSLEEFKEFFYNNNKQYIESEILPYNKLTKSGRDRYEVYYKDWMIDRPDKIIKRCIRVAYREFILGTRIFRRKIDFIDNIYCGSQWFSITNDCLEYILEYLNKNTNYSNFFRNSIYSDEMFFQTIVMNSKFAEDIENNNLRYINWSEQKESPKNLDIEDIKKAIASKCFFARKINSLKVIEYIDGLWNK